MFCVFNLNLAGALELLQMIQVKPSALLSKSATKKFADSETRDLKLQLDQLHKELERKEIRNEKLAKEMIQLRTVISNQEVIILCNPSASEIN